MPGSYNLDDALFTEKNKPERSSSRRRKDPADSSDEANPETGRVPPVGQARSSSQRSNQARDTDAVKVSREHNSADNGHNARTPSKAGTAPTAASENDVSTGSAVGGSGDSKVVIGGSENAGEKASGPAVAEHHASSSDPASSDVPTASAPPAMPSFSKEGSALDNILRRAVNDGASDIHLSVHSRPLYRLNGDLQPIPGFETELKSAWMVNALQGIMSDGQFSEYERDLEKDMSYNISGISRFRVNAFYQRQSPAAVFRVIPDRVMTMDELSIPEGIKDLSRRPRGLVLVTGPTGSGKSTTLAAMIDDINRTRPDHIMTIEDPIEFEHQNHRSLVNQREIGQDTKNFAEALKRVLRQDPDVILVGELRDPETISVALTAAETGHLVFGTLHTQSAAKTVNRIIDSFPSHQQNQVKTQLSDTLQGVVSQVLLKKIGGGRVMGSEIMVRNDAIANSIRQGKVSDIRNAIFSGRSQGMHTLDQNLIELVNAGIVSKHHAIPLLELPGESKDRMKDSTESDDWED